MLEILRFKSNSFWCLFRLVNQVSIELPPTESRGTAMGMRLLVYAIGTTVGTLVGALLILIISGIMDPTGTGTWIATPGTPLGQVPPTGIVFIILGVLPFFIAPLVIKHMKETKGVDLAQVK